MAFDAAKADAPLAPLPLPEFAVDLTPWDRSQQTLAKGEPIAIAEASGPLFMAAVAAAAVPRETTPHLQMEAFPLADDPLVVNLLVAVRAPEPDRDEPWRKRAADADDATALLAMTKARLTLKLNPDAVQAWRLPGGDWQPGAPQTSSAPSELNFSDIAVQLYELKLVPGAKGSLATLTWQWQEPGYTLVKESETQVQLTSSNQQPRLLRLLRIADDLAEVLRANDGRIPAAEANTLLARLRPLDQSRTVSDNAIVDKLSSLLTRWVELGRPPAPAADTP